MSKGDRISLSLRMAGLKGYAPDEACAAAFRATACAIEQQRGIEWQRGMKIKEVRIA
jgi:hypothetical protein